MAFSSEFYATPAAGLAAKKVAGKGSNLYIREITADSIDGTLNDANPSAAVMTFTSTFLVDEMIGGLILFRNNNDLGRFFEIDDNTSTDITFDLTASTIETDESANVTTSATYTCTVYSVKRAFGVTSEDTMIPAPTYKNFMVGTPEYSLVRELERMDITATFKARTLMGSVYKYCMNMDNANASSTVNDYYELGFQPSNVNRYVYLSWEDETDVNGDTVQFAIYRCCLGTDGGIATNIAASAFRELSITATAFIEPQHDAIVLISTEK